MITLESPLTVLKKEADQIRSVIAEVSAKITETHEHATQLGMQRATLILVAEAIDEKLDSMRANNPSQLELDLGD